MASKVLVLPWSTCPMMVTTGGRTSKSPSAPVSLSITVSSYKLMICTSQSYSEASKVAVSASMDWVMETIIPMDMSLAMISEAFRFIFFARSDTEIVSIISMEAGTALAEAACFFFWFLSSKKFSSSRSLR